MHVNDIRIMTVSFSRADAFELFLEQPQLGLPSSSAALRYQKLFP